MKNMNQKMIMLSSALALTLGMVSPSVSSTSLFDKAAEAVSAPQAKTEVAGQAGSLFADNALVGNVMSGLGLNEQQAAGGLGSLLTLVQGNLGDSDFSSLSKSIPGADALLGAVPALSGDSGMSGLLSQVGDVGSALQGSAMVYDTFEKLGISKELVGPMIDIAKQYLSQQSGQESVDLLMKGLGSLL